MNMFGIKDLVIWDYTIYRKIAREKLEKGLKFDISQDFTFCGSCTHGKQHCTKFSKSEQKAESPLGLVPSDLCGKMNEKSLSGV